MIIILLIVGLWVKLIICSIINLLKFMSPGITSTLILCVRILQSHYAIVKTTDMSGAAAGKCLTVDFLECNQIAKHNKNNVNF